MINMYGGIATKISSELKFVDNVVKNVRNIDFKSVWDSKSSIMLNESLVNCLDGISVLIEQFNTYNSALILMDEYIRLVEEIERLQSLLVNIVGEDEEAQAARASLEAQIASLMVQKNTVRAQLEELVSSLGGVSIDYNNILYSSSNNFTYICNLDELENAMNNLNGFGNLAVGLDGREGMSGQEYVDSRLNSVLSKFSGREAAVNYALMCGMLSVEAGAKIQYVNAGQNIGSIPYNNSSQLVDGMDCCSGVSLFVNSGTPNQNGFQWGGVQTFRSIAEKNDLYVNLSDALPGDVLVDNTDEFDHVVMIIENDPENQIVRIAEFSGDGFDIITETYDDYSAYRAVNMEGYYNGDLVYKHNN